MEDENLVSDQGDPWARMPDESDQEYERRLERRRKGREKQALADALKALAEKARGTAAQQKNDGANIDDEDAAEGPSQPSDPVAAEKAVREERWAKNREKDAQEDELTRHWEAARVAHIDSRGGLAALTRDLPPMDTGRWPLPRLAKPAEDRAPRPERPDAPPQDAETELTAIIAECRHFMRGLAFESARMTPDAGDRMGFIERACRLAETGATVGDTVARVRGMEVPVLAPARRR